MNTTEHGATGYAPATLVVGVASQEGHDAIAEALLQVGADVEKATNDGRTALMAAIGAEHNAVVKVLKKAGAKR